MTDMERQGLTLSNSAQFNATVQAARTSGMDAFADDLIKNAKWVDVDGGQQTRRIDLDPDQAEVARKLLCGVLSGTIAVHETYKPAAQEVLFNRAANLNV